MYTATDVPANTDKVCGVCGSAGFLRGCKQCSGPIFECFNCGYWLCTRSMTDFNFGCGSFKNDGVHWPGYSCSNSDADSDSSTHSRTLTGEIECVCAGVTEAEIKAQQSLFNEFAAEDNARPN